MGYCRLHSQLFDTASEGPSAGPLTSVVVKPIWCQYIYFVSVSTFLQIRIFGHPVVPISIHDCPMPRLRMSRSSRHAARLKSFGRWWSVLWTSRVRSCGCQPSSTWLQKKSKDLLFKETDFSIKDERVKCEICSTPPKPRKRSITLNDVGHWKILKLTKIAVV